MAMGRAAQHTTRRHGGQRASSSVERGVGGDGGRANVDADSRGKREDEERRRERRGKQGEQRVAREKVEREWWREGELTREHGEGERRRGSGERGGTSSASGRLRPEGVRGVEKDVRGESDGGRDVPGRTEVI